MNFPKKPRPTCAFARVQFIVLALQSRGRDLGSLIRFTLRPVLKGGVL